MTKKKLHIIFTVVAILVMGGSTLTLQAQERKVSRIEKRADRHFTQQKFDKAMEQYETAVQREQVEENKASLHLKTARLYFMLRDYPLSAEHYSKVMDMNSGMLTVEDVCDYVDALRFQGLNREAEAICLNNAYKDIYSKYQRYQNTLDALAMSHAMVADPAYQADRLRLNSGNAEFWVGIFDEQPFYAMSQSQFNDPGKLFFHRSRYYELKESDANSKSQLTPRFSDFFRRIPIDLQNGPVSFTSDLSVMVATVIQYAKSKTSVEVVDKSLRPFTTKLFYSRLEDKKHRFTRYEPIFPQEDGYSYAHPCLINDGLSLLFSSDIPGGYGGFDLYITHFDSTTGEWSYPSNLGPDINTEGDEIFPVLYGDRLIFSSNGMPGFGGYDLFSVSYNSRGVAPGSVFHFPYPVNSIFNDYYMRPVSDRNAYFISDRNFTGRDDIYYLTTLDDLGSSTAEQPYFGLTEEDAIMGGYLLLNGLTEEAQAKRVSLRQHAPDGLLLSVYFDFDSDQLTAESVAKLRNFLEALNEYQVNELRIDGFADEMGSDLYNQELSRKRANQVADFLKQNGLVQKVNTVAHGKIKLSPEEIRQELGTYNWEESAVDWIHVNRRARRVDIYNEKRYNK